MLPIIPSCSLTALRARQAKGIWYVSVVRTTGPGFTEADRAQAEATINDCLARQEARLARFPLVWRQELPITTYREGMTAFAMGEAFVEQLLRDDLDEGTITGLPVEISRFVIETALERAGQQVAGRWRRWLMLHSMAISATLAALVWLASSIGTSMRWPHLHPGQPRTVLAVHAEASNRTRHVRKSLAGCNPAETSVLFVGRSHLGVHGARAMLAEAGWHHSFALAWDWRTLLGGLPQGLALARHAASAIRAAGYRPTFAQLTAMQLRMMLGAGSARRWRRAGQGVETVVFGHVGRADTIMLEQAMQAMGAKTVHWMHGVSVGRAYQGVSDLCATLCEHDCAWHQSILNYRRNVHFALPQPAFRFGTKPGWAVLTNMTHYGYTYFPSIGPEHELRLVGMVAELAQRAKVDPASVIWKPHPVFYQRDTQVRDIVTRKVAEAGFFLWPEEVMPFEQSAAYETLIVTPSGVALDMLKLGRLPALVEFQPIDPEHVLAHLQPRGHDLETLARAIDLARDRVRSEILFGEVWAKVGPGSIGTVAEIEQALRTGERL